MMTVDEAYERDEKDPRPKGKPTWYDIREQQEEQVNNGLASMLLSRNMTGEQRLKALEGLAMIYINIPDDDDVKSVIDQFANHICHKCGEICTESTDYEHDDTYIICSGGSKLQFKDESKEIKRHRDQAHAWIFSSVGVTCEEFKTICYYAGLEPEKVRSFAYEVTQSGDTENVRRRFSSLIY